MDNEDILDTDFWKIVGVFFLFQIVFSNAGAFIISFFLGFFGLMSFIPILGFVFSVFFIYFAAKFASGIISSKFKCSERKLKYTLTFYAVCMAIIALFCNYILAASIVIQTGFFVFLTYKKCSSLIRRDGKDRIELMAT